MILRNPTDSDITVQIRGRVYTAPANGTIELPDAAALTWKKDIHQFMEVVAGSEQIVEDAPVIIEPNDAVIEDDDIEDDPL